MLHAGLDAYEAKRIAEEALVEAGKGNGYLEDNRGVDYPIKGVTFNGDNQPIGEKTQNAILDAKVFGAKIDKLYRITMIGNGITSNGKQRYGITLEERSRENFAETGGTNKHIFIYNNDNLSGNEGNANWQRISDGIETITVDNGEIAVSVTVDRKVITDSTYPEYMNVNTDSPTSIIDPSNYFF